MADPVEVIPLLVVALVMLSAGGADVTAIEVAVDGDRTVTAVEDVLIVGGGTLTVPSGERVTGPLYVIGGEATIAGRVDGDVVQLAGRLTVTERATITDELQSFGGERTVADDATVGRLTDLPDVVPTDPSPVEAALFLTARALGLALAGWVIARREPTLLANVGESITDYGLVSGTVGLLVSSTGVALLVFMALTVILIPISLLGLLFGIVVVAYANVAFGYLLGRWLPVEDVAQATAAGVVVFLLVIELLGRIPLVGGVLELIIVLVGIGAVLLTYLGLQPFEPAVLPE